MQVMQVAQAIPEQIIIMVAVVAVAPEAQAQQAILSMAATVAREF
jgi:hypothetical protein